MQTYLKSYFGYDSFRPLQQEIITHILAKKDCLVLMPTGGGKSICFQIPALMMEGTAIVVSPLISLMKDQVEALRANGIAAAALNSNYSEAENRSIREQALQGKLKLLYISPEKLLMEKDYLLKSIKVSLFAIDEAHCISQWGHDFRPEYTQLGQLREEFPEVPIAAFTATADKITKNDIIEQLRLCPPQSPLQGEVKTLKTADPILYSKLRKFSLDNRNNPTEAEELLWNYLKSDALGVRFRKQHVLDCFVVDFACLSHRITIELDGGYHFTADQQEYDKLRTEAITRLGFTELRFTNEELFNGIDKVLNRIREVLSHSPKAPLNPPFRGKQEPSAKTFTSPEGGDVRRTEGAAKVFISSFDRPNLSLDVRRGYSAKDKLRVILEVIRRHSYSSPEGGGWEGASGIVYCLSRKTTEKVAEDLRSKGINAKAYHAGMGPQERDRVQEDFINDRVQVVCATIAFGMGIDKSNVRFVVHYNMPKSMENYYQEIGRGGRDGLPCETVLFYNVGDIITLQGFAEESGQKEINNEKLDRMQEYAESQVCRRRILLNYFGETMDHDCCNCDVCKNPPQRFDGTINVQKALSAIARTNESVGFRMTIDILRGIKSLDVVDKQYYRLKTFGVGHDISSHDWQDYMLQMLHLGYIEIDYKDNSHLKITQQGKDVLFGRKKAELVALLNPPFRGKQKPSAKTFSSPEGGDVRRTEGAEDMMLFEKLRQLRMQVATDMGVPPYVVFGDRTLHELAIAKPETVTAFGAISGIGAHKRKQFGKTFVKAIREHKGLSVDESGTWSRVEVITFDSLPFSMPIPEKKVKAPRDFISIKGVEFKIDLDILESIKWRPAVDHISKDLYYNFNHETDVPMTRYVSDSIPNREKVIKRFAEIITEAYQVKVSPDYQTVTLPKRTEYDADGKEVHTLECTSFEDGLQQFRSFVDANHHYPFPGGGEYECSLRRWYQEVGRGIIEVTDTQRQAFEALAEQYADVPKVRKKPEKK